MAHDADMAILVARTDWDVPKHAGITYFLIDMRQPGVEVRQIVEMNITTRLTRCFLPMRECQYPTLLRDQ